MSIHKNDPSDTREPFVIAIIICRVVRMEIFAQQAIFDGV